MNQRASYTAVTTALLVTIGLAGCAPGPIASEVPSGTATPTATSEESGMRQPLVAMSMGDCFNDLTGAVGDGYANQGKASATVVPCVGTHDSEVFAVETLADEQDASEGSRRWKPSFDDSVPADLAHKAAAEEVCTSAFRDFVGVDIWESELSFEFLYPTESEWEDGDRDVVCWLVAEDESMQGTLKDSRR